MLSRRAFLRLSLWIPPTMLLTIGCSGATSGVTARLDYDSPVPLGGTMTFHLTATSAWDAPKPDAKPMATTKAEVYFSLPDAIVPLDPQWVADPPNDKFQIRPYRRPATLTAHIPQTFSLLVRLEQPGDHFLTAGAIVTANGNDAPGSDTLFLRVSASGTQIQREPFTPTA